MEICNRIEVDMNKYTVFYELMDAYGLLRRHDVFEYYAPALATKKQMAKFHSTEYLDSIMRVDQLRRRGLAIKKKLIQYD